MSAIQSLSRLCVHDFCFQLCSAVLTSFDFLSVLNLFVLGLIFAGVLEGDPVKFSLV